MSSPPAQTSEDVDMSTSTTLPPAGQRHDREDAIMQDGLPNGVQPDANSTQDRDQANNVAVEVAAVTADDDAMDTTPDSAQGVVLANGSAEVQDAAAVTPSSPAPDAMSHEEGINGTENSPEAPGDAPQTNNTPQGEPPVPADLASEPPPPPPPVEPVQTDTDSSDDDGGQPWHPITEDTSAPDEEELKEIEARTEFSALDHEHWENKAFTPLDDPEYTPGESGRIEWLIENYNGTREKPNRDLVMKSKPVTIGGHEWQIKFYPKGNDSDYLSVYVECLSVENESKEDGGDENSGSKQEGDASPSAVETTTTETPEFQHTPLPLVGSTAVPKRKSIAAQVSVVLYNPTEPRVNYSRTCLHRFCTSSPDWGWTRFHGPHFDIPHRIRGHRQALLRDDKLAFTGYIRIINDETKCLWEHPSSDNVWDSFAMTGLQSLAVRDNGGSPDGNVISAIASWLLFKPLRQFLYSFNVPDPEKEPFAQPKPLIGALQKVLYLLRTQVQPGASAINLEDIEDALEWYGLAEPLHKLDVIQVWEYIRAKLEDELRDTPSANSLESLFGPKRDYTKGVPSYRAPVIGVGNIQEAVNQSSELTVFGSPLPQLLTIELERQAFDSASRSYVKVINKVSLDDHIDDIRFMDSSYTSKLFNHTSTSQFCDRKGLVPSGTAIPIAEGNKVTCLTHRQAVTVHEGTEGTGRVTGNDPIAYIVLYSLSNGVPPPLPIPTSGDEASQPKEVEIPNDESTEVEERDFRIIDSATFLQHEGPGIFDAFDPKWQSDPTSLKSQITLKATDGCQEIRAKIATTLKDVKDIQDPRQVKFWFMDTFQGSFAQPNLLSTGKIEYSSGSYNRFVEELNDWKLQDNVRNWGCRRLWVHIIAFADLPELPKEPEPEPAPAPAPEISAETSSEQIAHFEQSRAADLPMNEDSDALSAEATQAVTQPVSEDTPMSEPDESEPQQTGLPPSDAEPPEPPTNAPEGDDAAMVEVDAPAPPDPPVVDVVIPTSTGEDTDMGGTQDNAAPAPPPPTDLAVETTSDPSNIEERPQTPPPAEVPRPQTPEPPPDEIYFFLKFFNAEKQTLESKGSFIVLKSARLDSTIQKLLEASDVKLELWEEEDLVQARSLRRHKSFSQNDLHNAATIIYALPRTDEQRDALAARAAFADLQQYLKFRANVRNFPSRMNGHFTFNYFSSQYYKGVYVNGHRHGHGSRIYHSGATYEGSFRLGLRHGHGLYTFQNGDTYDGDWINNQQHGTGSFVEATTGNTYTGGWKNDKKFGEGVTHWKSAQETERLCRICWEESADAAFYDCGHKEGAECDEALLRGVDITRSTPISN
ncbi:hypothetical protein N0V90_001601 [Kalmusia sp. IMI 367209]|nr:hypothetical protein N0V90_001601 [Kalmusia sp. IMI 367209]